MSIIIQNARKAIADVNGNESKAILETRSLSDLFEQRQHLLKKIDTACVEAVAKIKKKYQTELDNIDKEYAMLLVLTGDNKDLV